tara:strand:- start:876 stop:1649 length:774 start_codon:yes stop_codon:yes gene_type:complete
MKYVQLFDTTSLDLQKTDDGSYYFENDTVKITYYFWAEKGAIQFKIENKLGVPIYIDWKKSSYIDNTVKLNYWSDEVKTKTIGTGNSKTTYSTKTNTNKTVAVTSNASQVSSLTTSQERITFIPPKSIMYKNSFNIYPLPNFDFGMKPEYKEENSNFNPNTKTRIYYTNFTKSNTPVYFRNFLTFSLSEKFESEFYIDNGFFISKIREMEITQFQNYKLNDKGLLIRDSRGYTMKFDYYRNEGSFYLEIDRGDRIRN